MAKSRRLGWSRHERLLGSVAGGYSQGTEASDLGEEEVWSMVDRLVDSGNTPGQVAPGDWGSGGPENGVDRRGIRNGRWIGGGSRQVGGLSLAFDVDGRDPSSRIVHQWRGGDDVGSPRGKHMATSAPVDVPDWTRILRLHSVESMHGSDDDVEDDETERLPPHEYLAREYDRSRKTRATSVLEGVGRTLKGRDLSRVRDAVWSQTGFYG